MNPSFQLSKNFLKGELGDHINLLVVATTWNLKKWLNHFFVLVFQT